MHRLHALRGNRRCGEGEGYGKITVAEGVGVRWNSIHGEIGWLDTALVHRVAQIDDELRRLSADDAVAGRVGSGHGKTYQTCNSVISTQRSEEHTSELQSPYD